MNLFGYPIRITIIAIIYVDREIMLVNLSHSQLVRKAMMMNITIQTNRPM